MYGRVQDPQKGPSYRGSKMSRAWSDIASDRDLQSVCRSTYVFAFVDHLIIICDAN